MSSPNSFFPCIDILVVDDEAELASLLAQFLRRQGYVVEQMNHSRSAMEFLTEHWVRLIISDIFMPGGDGIELLNFLRRREPRPPLVAMSGTDDRFDGMLKLASVLGAARTLTKPFDPTQLLVIVHELIGPPTKAASVEPFAFPQAWRGH